MKKSPSKTIIAISLALTGLGANAQIKVDAAAYNDKVNIKFAIQDNAPDPIPLEIWQVKPASYLQDTLNDWAKRAGWTLVWKLAENEDLRMDAGNSYQGDFKQVVKDLFDSLPSKVRIYAELVPENTPPLLIINREAGSR